VLQTTSAVLHGICRFPHIRWLPIWKNQDANHNIQAAVSFRCSIRRTNSALDLSCPNDAPMSLSESYELLDFQNLWFLPCVSSKLPHICFLRPVINDVPARSTKLWRLTSFLSTSTSNYEFKHLKLHLIYTKFWPLRNIYAANMSSTIILEKKYASPYLTLLLPWLTHWSLKHWIANWLPNSTTRWQVILFNWVVVNKITLRL